MTRKNWSFSLYWLAFRMTWKMKASRRQTKTKKYSCQKFPQIGINLNTQIRFYAECTQFIGLWRHEMSFKITYARAIAYDRIGELLNFSCCKSCALNFNKYHSFGIFVSFNRKRDAKCLTGSLQTAQKYSGETLSVRDHIFNDPMA